MKRRARRPSSPSIIGAGNVQGVGAQPPAQSAPGVAGAPGRGGRGGGRGGQGGPGGATTPVASNIVVNPKGGVEEDYPLDARTRNFLDCVKSRNRKTNASMEIGYTSA